MKFKVSEATGRRLDLLVSMALHQTYWAELKLKGKITGWNTAEHYSTQWDQGGPIIEREFMDVEVTPMGAARPGKTDLWRAWHPSDNADATVMCGPTLLVAAMRCFVASRLGDEVDVPDELVVPGGAA